MRYLLFALLTSITTLFAQKKTPEDLGFRHLTLTYQGDAVDVLIKSKKGEENKAKPLFFFAQGSLPRPLIKYDQHGYYPVFPFDTEALCETYHLVIVSKPYIPVCADAQTLDNHNYVDATGQFPKAYNDRNLLSYYVPRNLAVIRYLQKQPWVSKQKLVAAGHSEGSTVVAKMAQQSRKITHLIYSGGNPLGRIASVIEQSRRRESDLEPLADADFSYWQAVVSHKTDLSDDGQGDSFRATYEFSQPPIQYMEDLKIPVLVTFGTRDYSATANDYFHVDCISRGKTNVTFKPYLGTEHNFFPITLDGKVDYDTYNWNKVAADWLSWLQQNP